MMRKPLHLGDEPVAHGLLGHFFDSKLASEANTQPKVRAPPLKVSQLN